MLTLRLQSAPNPDHDEWAAPAPSFDVEIPNLEQASLACRDYIDEFDLGAGNWIGGNVYSGDKRIARISYNGKIWT
jgi:hypothetical protein